MTRKKKSEDDPKHGALVEIRPGVWKVRVYVGTFDGKEVIRSRTFHAATVKEKNDRADAIRVQLREAGAERKANAEFVAGLVDEWFEIKQGKSSPTTITRIRPIVARIRKRLGHIRLDELNARDIDRFYAWLRTTPMERGRNLKEKRHLSESTVHHHHRVLSSIINTGERWGKLSGAVIRQVDRPERGTPKVAPPTREQIKAVIDKCDSDWAAVFAFAAATGLRRGEICAAKYTDIGPDGLTVRAAIVKTDDGTTERTTKTRRERIVPLDPAVRSLLERVRQRYQDTADAKGLKFAADAYLFADGSDPTGKTARHPDQVSATWRTKAKAAGVTARLHDLRHYAATYYLKAGIAVNDVANMLGHAQASTTVNVYGHTSRTSGIAEAMGEAVDIPQAKALPAVSS